MKTGSEIRESDVLIGWIQKFVLNKSIRWIPFCWTSWNEWNTRGYKIKISKKQSWAELDCFVILVFFLFYFVQFEMRWRLVFKRKLNRKMHLCDKCWTKVEFAKCSIDNQWKAKRGISGNHIKRWFRYVWKEEEMKVNTRELMRFKSRQDQKQLKALFLRSGLNDCKVLAAEVGRLSKRSRETDLCSCQRYLFVSRLSYLCLSLS